ncbi:tetratricopeptide repeat protein [Aquimarina gracilis]|uniref:Tetratricopeptide repeat protein n=1 Tax=Aquimarina gracilis TaxID=874422 RepID=A0ABU5ZZ80_9FLAO|nr:tetratricopeptide repeat protein [Aquimarina gracilis]MEB3347133.1 tetratricopeptide repeat protein [Aquimarina gracilis]
MKHYLVIIFGLQFGMLFAQEEQLQEAANEAKQYVASGNQVLVDEGNFPKAEGEYRKAIAKNPVDPTAKYNLANAYYNSEKYDEATQRYTEATKVASATKTEKHKAFHNQGNTYMEQKKYKEAVDAYKNALRNNPKDDETRYNLALAKKMLEQQQQQNDQDQDNKDQNQDQDQNQDNQDQKEGDDKEEKKGDDGENKDQQDQGDQGEDEKEEGENEKDEEGKPKDDQKDQGEQGEDGEPQQKQPQRPQGQLSPQQVKSLLEAMNNEEKKVQDKINAKKAQGSKVKTEKDW